MRRLTLFLVMTALLLVLTGCRGGGVPAESQTQKPSITETEETALLNERQIRILQEQGLPTRYEELTLSQKSAIESVEDMLCYLEQHYEDHFAYAGYVADSQVEQEHLLASSMRYPDSGLVTVYRSYENGSFRYQDNYSTLQGKLLYEQALNDWLVQFIPDSQFIVFSQLDKAEDEPRQEEILSQASATSYIYIAREACTEEALLALVERFGPWMQEQSRKSQSSLTLFYLAAQEDLAVASNETYLDLLPKLREAPHYSCSIATDGTLKIS